MSPMQLEKIGQVISYALGVFVISLLVMIVYQDCAHTAHAESRDRITARGLVGESDGHEPDYGPCLVVFGTRSRDWAAGAMAYSAIFKPILPSTPAPIAARRRDILEERSPRRRHQIDRAVEFIDLWRHGEIGGSGCTQLPEEEGDRYGDSERARRAGWIQVNCGPECMLPLAAHPENAASCVVNRYWRHPARGARAVSAALARGARPMRLLGSNAPNAGEARERP